MVDAALSMAASELTTAPSRAARTKPTMPTPCGRTFPSNWASAVSYLNAIIFSDVVSLPATPAAARTPWLNASISSARPGLTAAQEWSSLTNTVNSPACLLLNSERVIGSTYGLRVSLALMAWASEKTASR